MSGLHLFNFDIIVKLCLKTPCTQLLRITTSNAQFQPNKRSEERRFCVTWPQYEANCLAGTGIGHGTRSFCQRSGTRNIRSNYGHISFKKKKQSQASAHVNIKFILLNCWVTFISGVCFLFCKLMKARFPPVFQQNSTITQFCYKPLRATPLLC